MAGERVGRGVTVVLLHNAGADHHAYDPLVERLSAKYDCVALDLPGFGASGAPVAWTLPALVDELEAALDALELPQVHLVGHCVGGAIAWTYALRHPERVAKLALLSPATLRVSRSGSVAPALRVCATGPRGEAMALAVGRWATGWAPVRRRLARDQLGAAPPASAVAYAEARLKSSKSLASLAAIGGGFGSFAALDRDDATPPAPTLLLWGDHNGVLPVRARRFVVPQLRPERVSLLAGCGHLAHVERPDVVAAELLSFFR